MGFIHVSGRQADNANSFDIPGYERVDLNVAYEQGPFSVRASVENVLNQDYVLGATGSGPLTQGAPRFFTLTVGYEFQ